MFLSPLLLERYAPSSSIVEITSFFIFSFLGGGCSFSIPSPAVEIALLFIPLLFWADFASTFPFPCDGGQSRGIKREGDTLKERGGENP